jgi:hypothetical protein
MAVGHPGVMTMPGSNDRVRVEFQLDHDDDGWPPATTERLWAVPLGEGLVRIDNIPWFVRNIAFGDIVQTRTDPDGGLWAAERIQWSGHCTIRVVPFDDGALAGSRQAVLAALAPLGVEGEGIERFGLVALDVPPAVDLGAVKRLLGRGAKDGWWDYEEGCVSDAWLALEP